MESSKSDSYLLPNYRLPPSPRAANKNHATQRSHHRHNHQQQSPKSQRQHNNQKYKQQQQQQQQNRHPSSQPVTLHIRSHPSPPVRPKHRHNDKSQNPSPQKEGKSYRPNNQQQNQQPPQPPRKLHLHLHPQNNQPLVLSSKKQGRDESPVHVVTSQPGVSSGKQQPNTHGASRNTNNPMEKTNKDPKGLNHKTNKNNTNQNSSSEHQRKTSGSPKPAKYSKYSVGASETGQPRRFGDSPDKKPDLPVRNVDKYHDNELSAIPQTNLNVGLIVFCCFNPLFGALAIYLSLAAARAYRDGYEARGSSRAHWSILVSLFGITVTMVIVSTLVVVFSVSKHTNSHYKRMASQALGF